jgi:hypothetical protein
MNVPFHVVNIMYWDQRHLIFLEFTLHEKRTNLVIERSSLLLKTSLYEGTIFILGGSKSYFVIFCLGGSVFTHNSLYGMEHLPKTIV